MKDFASMSLEERRVALRAASHAIGAAVALLRPHVVLFDAFKREQEYMESIGCIIDPTLYKSRERREVADMMAPLYAASTRLVETFEAQINAVVEQAVKGET